MTKRDLVDPNNKYDVPKTIHRISPNKLVWFPKCDLCHPLSDDQLNSDAMSTNAIIIFSQMEKAKAHRNIKLIHQVV